MADKFIGDSGLVKAHIADEALAVNRFVKGVTQTGPPPHVVYSDAGEVSIGVTRLPYASGEVADIIYDGTAYVMTSVNIAVNDPIAAAADGACAVATTSNHVLGIAVGEANSGTPVLVKLGYGGIF
jgi:hypothetical protein